MIQLRYFPGNTFLHRLDARTKLFIILLYVFIEVVFRDVRILAVPLLVSVLLYLSAKVPFKEVKSTWKFLLFTVGVISSVNIIFTLVGTSVSSPHVIAKISFLSVSEEGLSLAAAAAMKLFALATITLAAVLTTNPSDYAPALAKMGVPYKIAFVFDLAMRYIPTYAEDLETTMKAQMARGHKLSGGSGVIGGIVNTVPLLVPVAMSAMLSIYDIADAMELRAFGVERKRVWYRDIRFARMDYAVILVLAATFVLVVYLRVLFPGYWVP